MLNKKIVTKRTKSLTFLFAITLGLLGCTRDTPAQQQSIDVRWGSGFTMPTLLAESLTVRSQEDIAALLDKPWYAQIDIQNAKRADVNVLADCRSYFANKTPALRALRDSENNALMELRMMCEAAQLLATAGKSSESYLPDDVLTADAPNQFPKHMALVTSQVESEKIQQDASKQLWGEVNTITDTAGHSSQQMHFHSEAGLQQVSVVGRGDMNGDRIEDVVMLSRDSVEGGSYFNLRLFVLTVNRQGQWQLVSAHQT